MVGALSSEGDDGKPESSDSRWMGARQRLIRDETLFRGTGEPPPNALCHVLPGEGMSEVVRRLRSGPFRFRLGSRAGLALELGPAPFCGVQRGELDGRTISWPVRPASDDLLVALGQPETTSG